MPHPDVSDPDVPDPDKRVQYRGTGFYLGLVAILVFALVLLVLAVQNTQEVDVDFFGLAFTVPLFAVAIGAAILAVVLDELIGLAWRKQRRIHLEERAELDRFRAADAPTDAQADGPADASAAEQPGEPAESEMEPTDDQGDTPSGHTPTP